MTVDDVNSIYVGSLPYSATEDSIRRAFGPYGAIVAVKIINDYGTRGKCFCFVTFRNPRSVIDAIDDMNGKTIDGRVVRVNGVTSRGGRPNVSRERFRRNAERSLNSDMGRDRDRDRFRDRYSERSRERDEQRGRENEIAHDHDRVKDGLPGGDQRQDGGMVDHEPRERRNGVWNLERGSDFPSGQEREIDGTRGDCKLVDEQKDHQLRKLNEYNDQCSGELPSDSSDDYSDEGEERLERSMQRRDELKDEISEMEKKLEDKQQFVSNLKKRTQTLEDALIMAKRRSTQHKMQLTKLRKCCVQVKEYSKKLKNCEQELQSLVDSALTQNDMAGDVGMRDGILIDGDA